MAPNGAGPRWRGRKSMNYILNLFLKQSQGGNATQISKMTITLSEAAESDADRIATIHMAAFGPNKLLRAQFPTEATREGLQVCIADKALRDIRDPKTAVLVIRDQNEIISFAKWHFPIPRGEEYEEPPWIWPEGTNFAVLDEWTERAQAVYLKILGNTPCYRELPRDPLCGLSISSYFPTLFMREISNVLIGNLSEVEGILFLSAYALLGYVGFPLTSTHFHIGLSFVGTDPAHERRGAGSQLIQWGTERCKAEKVPAYLEGTSNASTLYERLGFKAEGHISMLLETMGEHGVSLMYEETCFVFRPDGGEPEAEISIH